MFKKALSYLLGAFAIVGSTSAVAEEHISRITPSSAAPHYYANGINSAGEISYGQPNISDLTAITAYSVICNATSGSAVPTACTTLPTGLTLPSPTITGTPVFPAASISPTALINPSNSVQTNATLTALSTATLSSNAIVFRQGFSSPGDGGEMAYSASNSACSLNSGNGDGGSQVKSADSKCWLWQPHGYKVTPMVFGAMGNGTADDTIQVKSALLALAGNPLYVGNFLYGISSTITTNSDIEGDGGGQGIYNSTCLSGFRILSGGFDAINPGRASLNIRNICMDAAGGVTSTFGGIIEIGTHSSLVIEKSQFNKICKPIGVSGSGASQNVNSKVIDNVIITVNSSSCAGIIIGVNSTGGNTVDTTVKGNNIYCGSSNSDGMIFYDAGGAFISENDAYGCAHGTKIIPGTNQQFIWAYFNNTAIGDTSGINDLLIDPQQVSSVILGLSFSASWTSNAQGGHNVLIQNTGGTTSYSGIRFHGHRTYIGNTSFDGFHIVAGKDVAIDAGSTICSGAVNTHSGIDVSANVSNFSLDSSRVGYCDQFSGTLATGLNVASGVSNYRIIGNDFTYSTVPASLPDSATQNAVIKDNIGIDTIAPIVASSGSVLLPPNSTIFFSGTTTVSTMTGRWQNRQATLIVPSGGLTFNTGGNICNVVTPAANSPVTATWNVGYACWFMTSGAGSVVNNLWHIQTLAALQASPTLSYPDGVWRDDYASGNAAGPLFFIPETGTCAANSFVNDGGSCVNTTIGDGNSWVARPDNGQLSVKQFGAKGDGATDDGPSFRAAIVACQASTGFHRLYIPNPSTTYLLSTLHSSGLGAIVIGDGVNSNSCSFEGEGENTWGDYVGGVNVKLGAGLNRPLVYVRTKAASPVFKNVRLDGNSSAQAGWSGGPGNKLYTIQVEDGAASPEASIKMYDSWVVGGYNGNLYIGSGRGATFLYNTWFQYSGLTTATDTSVYLNGYDFTATNVQVGPNTGTGVFIAEGAQYQFLNSAIFLNSGDGLKINGGFVAYLTSTGMNVQQNGCNGINELSTAPAGSVVPVAHLFSLTTFDGNSHTTTNVCSDIVNNNALSLLSFSGVAFNGTATSGNPLPKYNVDAVGAGYIRLANPVFSSVPNGTAWTNVPALVLCSNCNITNTWTPTLVGATTAGSPTYSVQNGTWSRNNNEVTVHFNISVSSLGGATGNLTIQGIPYFSSATANDNSSCIFNGLSGWTAQAGYTTLSGLPGVSTAIIYLSENGSMVSSALANATEFAASTTLRGTCVYHTDN